VPADAANVRSPALSLFISGPEAGQVATLGREDVDSVPDHRRNTLKHSPKHKELQMRFMIIVKATPDSEAGVMPEEKLISDMAAYHEELKKAGMLTNGSGLQPSSKGWRIKYSKGIAPWSTVRLPRPRSLSPAKR
jgi:hypothetical protein